MRLKRLAVIAAATASLIVPTVIVAASSPAQAAGQICENGGSSLCLNDWNGTSSGAVKMGQNGWTHQNFGVFQLTTACGAGRVTHTCPFTVGTGLNDQMFDSIIVATKYLGNGQCVGTGQNTRGAVLTTCPSNGGTGGGWGTLTVERQNVNNCFSQNGDTQLMNVHWSSADVTDDNLVGSTVQGNQAEVIVNVNFNVACWGTG